MDLDPKILKNNDFSYYGGCYVHSKLGIVIVTDPEEGIEIVTDDLTNSEIEDIVENHSESLIEVLIDAVKCKKSENKSEPGFIDEKDESVNEGLDFEYLKSLVEINDPKRKLTIYTWGKRLKKSKPHQSQHNFNASILNGRAKGIDLRNNNGLYLPIQKVVSRCSSFETWINMAIKKIETDDLISISINCAKGRHRSVAVAEILKKVYYPDSKIIHLTIR
uniref:RapZ C-terminal domain-containing protein n=1 Tax=Pithovirus LCPAC001 TaxID=2506585 RepID=A0A481Z1D5_9VIRU|nr:MAG: hypothetical protein LCPAC001_00220 [Pithovirus LCPAC001]